jgi:cell division protein FtsA
MDNKVGAIVNIGAETMNVSLYNKGSIVKNSIINAGSIIIDLDIAKTYNVSLEKAKKIKERFAVAHAKYASKNEYYDVTTNDSKKIRINQLELSEQVTKRYLKLIELAVKEIASLSGKSLDYVVFTGGATNAYHFHSLIEDKLGKKASIGEVKIVGLRNNQNTAALGNIIYFINKLKLKGTEYSMINEEQTESLASVKNNTANISSDSMLNKVVSYFFGE